MSQNVILKAILDIKDVENKLNDISKAGKFSKSIAEGTKQANNEFNSLSSTLRDLETRLNNAKRVGFGGDTTALKSINNEYKSLIANVDKFRAKNKESLQLTNEIANKVIANASKTRGISTKLASVYQQGGVAGVADVALNRPEQLMSRSAIRGSKLIGLENLSKSGQVDVNAFRNYQSNINQITKSLTDVQKAQQVFDQMEHKINKLSSTTNTYAKTAEGAAGATGKMVNFLNKAGIAGNSLGQIFGTLASKVLTWMGTTALIYGAVAAIKSLVSSAIEYDDQLNKLKRVLNGTNDEIKQQLSLVRPFAQEMNKLTGADFTSTITSLRETVKAGFNMAESMAITRTSLLASNIAEMDAAESTKYFLSTMRQFNLTAYDSLYILDQWNKLGQDTGAETKDIAEAVTKAGSAFKAVGGSLEQLNAIAAVTVEATGQTGDVIGTMVKTLSARYADLTKRQSVSNEMAKYGIQVYDKQTGTYNSVYSTLNQLAEVWPTLTEAQQANIAKVNAGIYHYSRFMAMMENFPRINDQWINALNAQGSAIEENKTAQESLTFTIKKLQGAWENLASSRGMLLFLSLLGISLDTIAGALNIITLNFDMFKAKAMDMSNIDLGLEQKAKQVQSFAEQSRELLETYNNTKTSDSTKQAIAKTFESYGLKIDQVNKKLKDSSGPKAFFNNIAESLKVFDNIQYRLTTIFDIMKKEGKTNVGGYTILGGISTQALQDKLRSMADVEIEVLQDYTQKYTDATNKLETKFKKGVNSENTRAQYNALSRIAKTSLEFVSDKLGLIKGPDIQATILSLNDILKRSIAPEKGKLQFNEGNPGDEAETPEEKAKRLDREKKEAYRTDWEAYKQYWEMKDEIVQKHYDKIRKLNEEILSKMTGELFSLDRGTDFGTRIMKTISGGLEAAMSQQVNEFTTQLTNLFTGPRPDMYSEQLKLAATIGGESMKQSIIDGAREASPNFTNAIMQGIVNLQTNAGAKAALDNMPQVPTLPATDAEAKAMAEKMNANMDLTKQIGVNIPSTTTSTTPATPATPAKPGINIMASVDKALSTFDPISMLTSMGLSTLFGFGVNLIGGLLAPKPQEEKQKEETVQYAKESTKQLKQVNRNLTKLVEQSKPWTILDQSYYFSVSNARGMV